MRTLDQIPYYTPIYTVSPCIHSRTAVALVGYTYSTLNEQHLGCLIDIEESLKGVIRSRWTRREYKQGRACGPVARYIGP